jgi:serine protease Do
MPGFDDDNGLPDIFRHFRIPSPRDMPLRGQGSGFIISPDGIVLTNAHVVDGADEVTVKLTDRREFKAKVLGKDKPSDIAVLKIDAKNLPSVAIGEPSSSRVGEWVLAIGAPFGFENSVTAGIISAKSRSLPDEGVVPFIQTDVAINPGNSGGPLFNLNGEVIGVNSQIYSQSGGYQGLSFAIPIDVAMKVERQLVDKGKVSRGRLGVLIQQVDQPLAESFKLDKPSGALVSEVERGSPADKAGIEPGDVILKFEGKEIARSADLPPLVADVAPGTKSEVQIWRKGKSQTLTVKLGEMKVESGSADTSSDAPAKGKLGIAARPLTDEERKDADLKSGLVVERIGDGPAARAGIRQGDIIVSVNGESVTSVEQLRSLIDKRGKHIALQVQRDDRKLFVPIELG